MEKDVTPTPMDKAQETWQTYLQKCCEYGQLQHAIHQLDSQRLEIEKKIDITMRQANDAALKHHQIKKDLADKVQLPKTEETKEAH
jgi:hypothetical protein